MLPTKNACIKPRIAVYRFQWQPVVKGKAGLVMCQNADFLYEVPVGLLIGVGSAGMLVVLCLPWHAIPCFQTWLNLWKTQHPYVVTFVSLQGHRKYFCHLTRRLAPPCLRMKTSFAPSSSVLTSPPFGTVVFTAGMLKTATRNRHSSAKGVSQAVLLHHIQNKPKYGGVVWGNLSVAAGFVGKVQLWKRE